MLKQIKRTFRYRTLLRDGDANLYVLQAFDEAAKSEAQRLHAATYFRYGYLQESDLTHDGRMNRTEDPYQDHSRYFAVREQSSRNLVATSRVIEHHAAKGHLSFQTLEHQEIEEQYLGYLKGLTPGQCAEVSGLAKQSGVSTYATMLLYRAMWQYSLKAGQLVWVMSCDEKLFNRLRLLFGKSLVKIGPTSFYKGHDIVPSMLHLSESLNILIRSTHDINLLRRSLKLDLLRFFLTGVDESLLTEQQKSVLKRLNLKDEKGVAYE